MTDESKFFALIQAQQQRAKWKGSTARCTPAAHDGVHRFSNLKLHPVRASITNVRAVGSLCDDPFQAILFCQSEQRSEEHTSELQSRSDLVCRLLLEKKKTSLDQLTRHTDQ